MSSDGLNAMLTTVLSDPLMMMKMCSNEMPFGTSLTTVKPSSTHGNGLFANDDIKAGQVITMYPIHQYAKRVAGNQWKIHSIMNSETPYHGYALDIDENTKIYGCPTFYNTMFQGHLANDPLISLDGSDVNKFIISYLIASKVKGNARFDKNSHLVYIRAVRDIKAGEEILIPYSLPYWFTYLKIDEDQAMSNFLKYLETQPVEKHKFVVDLMDFLSKTF